MVLMGCSTTFQTSKIQNYEWNAEQEDYTPTTFIYNRDCDFKFNKKKILFSIEDDENGIETHIIEIASMIETKNIETVEYINVYRGILDNEQYCKVAYYKSQNIVIVFGGKVEDRYTTFLIFGNQ